jgi:signal transduction histidine kinase
MVAMHGASVVRVRLRSVPDPAGSAPELDDNPRTRPHLAAIGNAARHMQHLIDPLLDVARLEHGTLGLAFERCEVATVLGAPRSLFQIRAGSPSPRGATGRASGSRSPDRAAVRRGLDVLVHAAGGASE